MNNMDYQKILQERIEEDCRKALCGDEPTQTFSETPWTYEDMKRDIEEAMELLNHKKKEPQFNNWECLSKYYGPVLKKPPVIIKNIVA